MSITVWRQVGKPTHIGNLGVNGDECSALRPGRFNLGEIFRCIVKMTRTTIIRLVYNQFKIILYGLTDDLMPYIPMDIIIWISLW